MTLIWRSTPRVEIGGRFRAVAESRFHPSTPVWIVERIYDGPDGRAHAVVVNNADPTVRKTFSVDVLADAKRYQPVPQNPGADRSA
jgi:hypothetical protein